MRESRSLEKALPGARADEETKVGEEAKKEAAGVAGEGVLLG